MARPRLKLEALEDRTIPAVYTWSGAVDSNFFTLNNWRLPDLSVPLVAPSTNDTVIIANLPSEGHAMHLGSDRDIRRLVMLGNASGDIILSAKLTIDGGATLPEGDGEGATRLTHGGVYLVGEGAELVFKRQPQFFPVQLGSGIYGVDPQATGGRIVFDTTYAEVVKGDKPATKAGDHTLRLNNINEVLVGRDYATRSTLDFRYYSDLVDPVRIDGRATQVRISDGSHVNIQPKTLAGAAGDVLSNSGATFVVGTNSLSGFRAVESHLQGVLVFVAGTDPLTTSFEPKVLVNSAGRVHFELRTNVAFTHADPTGFAMEVSGGSVLVNRVAKVSVPNSPFGILLYNDAYMGLLTLDAGFPFPSRFDCGLVLQSSDLYVGNRTELYVTNLSLQGDSSLEIGVDELAEYSGRLRVAGAFSIASPLVDLLVTWTLETGSPEPGTIHEIITVEGAWDGYAGPDSWFDDLFIEFPYDMLFWSGHEVLIGV